ncbi:MAG: MATE family efflux transporter [Alphaproteobacteria bacterium]|nr:MATE family efflux transporter [Alphaproteobacteria bacterium]
MNTSSASLPTSRREWHRRVWRLAGPIILSNMSVPLLGAVDTAVVGHLPDPAYIGAVAIGAIIFNFIYWGFGFLRMGTTGFTAQALGARDWQEIRAIIARGIIISLGLAVVILAGQSLIRGAAFWLIEASGDVEALAVTYYDVRVWGAPAALANYAVLGWLLGIQRPRTALVLQIVLNGINIALDLWFVLGLGWGVEGVAFATVISEYSAALLGLWIVHRALIAAGGNWRRDQILDRTRLIAFARVNGDIFIRTLCLIFAFSYFTAQSARMGDVLLAANAVLMHFQHFMAYGLDGFAFAAEALIGGAVGARNREALRAGVSVTTQWAFAISGIYVLVYALLGTEIIGVLTGIEEVRSAAAQFLPWAIVMPLISVWSFQLDGIFIGATRTGEMRNAMIVSVAIYLAAVHLLLPIMGNHGLWLALMVYMVARAVTLGLYYPRVVQAADPISR